MNRCSLMAGAHSVPSFCRILAVMQLVMCRKWQSACSLHHKHTQAYRKPSHLHSQSQTDWHSPNHQVEVVVALSPVTITTTANDTAAALNTGVETSVTLCCCVCWLRVSTSIQHDATHLTTKVAKLSTIYNHINQQASSHADAQHDGSSMLHQSHLPDMHCIPTISNGSTTCPHTRLH